MKLVIQIPCYNEAETLAQTLADLPRCVKGFDKVEWLVVDDGSSDRTVQEAERCGVDHIVTHTHNQGLAAAFMTGLEAALEIGADVIVNTDADNQYAATSIQALVDPIMARQAEIVIGTRPIDSIDHFSITKKALQKIGSWVVKIASNTDIADAPSGFRAFSRDAAKRMHVFSNYTYTLETIIQAGQKNISITSVPIEVNGATRPSRLVKNIPSYVSRSILTILRIFIIYQPFKFFAIIAIALIGLGVLLGLRFIHFYLTGDGGGHIQSVVLSASLLAMGLQTLLIAFVSDLIAANRKLLETIEYQQKEFFENSMHKKSDIDL